MIAREGLPFVGVGLVATAALGIAFGWAAGAPAGLATLFVAYFFRDPNREPPDDPSLIVSPADGRVLEVTEVTDVNGDSKKVVIFLSIFDVHINRVPASGRVLSVRYRPGRFRMGFSPRASEENEQNAILLEMEGGRSLVWVQIAGFIARRIVCRLKEGDRVTRGDRFGLIRFGSRMDVFLPRDLEPLVKRGDRVRGGETPIARMP